MVPFTSVRSALLVLLLCGQASLFAQEKCPDCKGPDAKGGVRFIDLDFSEGCKAPNLSCLEKMQKGDFYRVRVKGVNLNLYKVSVNGRDTAATSKIEFPTFALFGVDALKSLAGGVGVLSTTAAGGGGQDAGTLTLQPTAEFMSVSALDVRGEENAIRSQLKGALSPYEAAVENIADSARKDRWLNMVQKYTVVFKSTEGVNAVNAEIEKQAQLGSIKERMNAESKWIGAEATTLDSLRKVLDDLVLSINKYVLRTKAETAANPFMAQLADPSFNVATVMERVTLARARLSRDKGILADRKAAYEKFAADNKAAIEASDELKGMNGKINDGYKKLDTVVTEALPTVTAEKVNELLGSVVQLANNVGKDYISLPLQYKGGAGAVNVKVEPIDAAKSFLSSYGTTLYFPTRKTSYGGVSLAFYTGGLHDEAFSSRKVSTTVDTVTTVTYDLVTEDPGESEFGATALFTLGGKFKHEGDFGGQFVVGPGVSLTDKVKPRLLLGGGLSAGKKHMILLNAGVILGYVQQRANAYSSDTGYTEAPTNITVATLKSSWFVSLGYMFKL